MKERVRVATLPCLDKINFPEAKDELHALLIKYHQILSLPGDPVGTINVLIHHIPIDANACPVHMPSYRVPHAQRAVIDQAVQDMLAEGVRRG